jgi:hypothetical protein
VALTGLLVGAPAAGVLIFAQPPVPWDSDRNSPAWPQASRQPTLLRAPGGCVDVDQPSRSRLIPRCLVIPLRLSDNPDRGGVLLMFTQTQRTKPALNAFAITLEGRIPARRSSGSGSDR